jgi:hypothetical protein
MTSAGGRCAPPDHRLHGRRDHPERQPIGTRRFHANRARVGRADHLARQPRPVRRNPGSDRGQAPSSPPSTLARVPHLASSSQRRNLSRYTSGIQGASGHYRVSSRAWPNQLTGVSAPVEGRKWERLTMAVLILRTTLSSSTRYLMGSVAVRSGVAIRVPVVALQRRIWNAMKAVHRPGLRRFRRRNRHRTGLPRER